MFTRYRIKSITVLDKCPVKMIRRHSGYMLVQLLEERKPYNKGDRINILFRELEKVRDFDLYNV